jgi:signal peptidase I
MAPAIPFDTRITVNRLAYRHHSVQRGDIIVFATPPAENCGGGPVRDLIKRVIGLPGETISLSSGTAVPFGGTADYVTIDGKRLDESWLPKSERGTTYPGPAGTAYDLSKPYKIPEGNYFVMGDKRTDSCDSRYYGPIPKRLIVGKVELPSRS